MALTASVDTSKSPFELTIVSDKRKFSGTVTVTSAGDTGTADYAGVFPLNISDSSGRVWSKKSDDGATAIYVGS